MARPSRRRAYPPLPEVVKGRIADYWAAFAKSISRILVLCWTYGTCPAPAHDMRNDWSPAAVAAFRHEEQVAGQPLPADQHPRAGSQD